MTALRVFPFIGALVAIAAVVLAIIGVSTTYWFQTALNTHSGKGKLDFNIQKKRIRLLIIRSLAKLCSWYLCRN
jgi:hypothetical protein